MTTTYTAAAQLPPNDHWQGQVHGGNMDSVRYFHSSQTNTRSRSGSSSERARGPALGRDNAFTPYRSTAEHVGGYAPGHSRRATEELDDEDDSAWIHRDKLARIENKEMQEAGLGMHTLDLAAHTKSEDPPGQSARSSRSKKIPRMSPPISTQGLIETSGFGFEDADDTMAGDQNTISRPGTSRIPINKKSPVPLSSSYTERDSPLGRISSNSTSLGTSPELKVTKPRPRSQSLGGEAMLKAATTPSKQRPVSSHFVDSPLLSESSDSSINTGKRLKPMSKSPAGKNGSVKSRVASGSSSKDSPSGRPKSRARPHSPHRPEGEAPWIATMYKPDPMLPPDQQILPTHAKKLMQEQWSREGKHGDAYDRNFNQLNSNDMTASRPNTARLAINTSASPDFTLAGQGFLPPQNPPPSSPLPELPPSVSGSRQGSHSASRQGSYGGGYRVTPTITPSPSPGPRSGTPGSQRSPQKLRDADPRISAIPPIPQRSPHRTDDDIELRDGILVHRLDPTKLASNKNESTDHDADSGGGCGLKCVIM